MKKDSKSILGQIREAGVIGAGGAGFPTYKKLESSVDHIIANGAECEPLLQKDRETMLREPDSFLRGLEIMQQLTGASHVTIAVKAKNGVMVVDPNDFVVSRQLLQMGEYDWPEILQLLDLVDGDSSVVVVGAHIGSLLIPLARNVRDVTGFEPNPINFQLLQNNVSINNLQNVQL